MATYDDILDHYAGRGQRRPARHGGRPARTRLWTRPWLESVQIRLPWLIVNMVTSMMVGLWVYMFEGSIAGMALLAVLMPMVANQAGNTGSRRSP